MRRCRLPWVVLCAAGMTCLSVAGAVAGPAGPGSWLGTWASSQQIPEPRNALPAAQLRNAMLRQIVHLTVGGKVLRVRLSNVFGTAPLKRLLPAYDCGDHLHPSPAGYRAMAAAVPLSLFSNRLRTPR